MTKTKKNRLAKCTSPYLQQHADNPVDWYPWGEEALRLARVQDKPILLSIGYSACHWCHVMAHESFADEETAAVMNKHFINIKVDKEERPDLDKIYQLAFQLLLGRAGGWPLTMFLTPDNNIPFFGGTYFPIEARYGMPAFKEVLLHIAELFHEQRDAIQLQNSQFEKILQQTQTSEYHPQTQLNLIPIYRALEQLANDFDPVHGGFAAAPKFPMPLIIEFLLQQRSDRALSMALTTLNKMAQSGIYDQLGGGFFRYSVDEEWMIPHFEKMLYDNSLLLEVYVLAYQTTKNLTYKNIAVAIAEWVMREMQSAEGGYYATLDADSEGEEGKYYYWYPEHVQAILSNAEFQVISQVYGLDHPANFAGHWHLHTLQNVDVVAANMQISANKAAQLLKTAKQKLFKAREKRSRPHRDEKIITSWNGLMIKAMALAGQQLECPEFLKSAQKAHAFIYKNLWKNHRLHATYKDAEISQTGFLDDYAFMLDATLTLLQLHNRKTNLKFAIDLAEGLLKHYQDKSSGGFYFTADDHEQLLLRPKSFMDEALPSGNGIAALALLKLGYLVDEPSYLKAGEETLKSAWSAIINAPTAHISILLALQNLFKESASHQT